ncbi:MAG: hypothetical protein AAF846_15940 [Chloroflexota bacterium]
MKYISVLILLSLLFVSIVTAQEDTMQTFDFEIHNNNQAVIPLGEAGAWDSVQVWSPQIIEHDDLYYMFYTGNSQSGLMNTAIGYATSTDGYTWEKASANPIYQYFYTGEYQSYPIPVTLGRVLVEDDGTWVMYYTFPNLAWGLPTGEIYRATASNPDGPWVQEETPVLVGGMPNSWNYHIGPQNIFKVGDEYRLYYTGFMGRNQRDEEAWSNPQIGLATSSDGVNFTHIETPILATAEDNEWESYGVTSATVRQTETGWELFYIGHPRPIYTFPNPENSYLQVGYATSSDGINWTRQSENPIATTEETGWPLLGVLVIDDTYFLYYDHNWGASGISLMTATVTE